MDAELPTPPSNEKAASAADKYRSLLNNCQRDINRCCDQQDRNLRKRGLQKLLDDLPWTGRGGSGTKKALKQVITNDLLPPLIGVASVSSNDTDNSMNSYRPGGLLADPIEKCRELSLQLVKKILENVSSLGSNALIAILKALVRRINNNPFPETVEELRLILVENMLIAVTCAQAQHNKIQDKKSKEDSNEDGDEGEKEEGKGDSEAKEGAGLVSFEESKYRSVLEEVIQALPYASLDNFPAVKRATAALYISIATNCPLLTRLYFKKVAYGMGENALHQHSKTRVLAVRALKTALVHVTDEFEFVMGKRDGPPDAENMQDPSRTWDVGVSTLAGAATVDGTAIPTSSSNNVKSKKVNLSILFMKLLADSNASVRKELCLLCKDVLLVRLARYTGLCNSAGEIEIIVLLLLLLGDEVTEVSQTAMDSLEAACSMWTGEGIDFDEVQEVSTSKVKSKVGLAGDDVEDAEAKMRSLNVSDDRDKTATGSNDKALQSSRFVANHIHSLSDLFIKGIAEWTQTSQLTYLRGLDSMLLLAGAQGITAVLSTLLIALGGPCRDDHVAIRLAAEQCCARIGQVLPDPLECVELLLPGVAGIRAGGGGDTASQRALAVRVLTCVLKGLPYACVDGHTGSCALLDTIGCFPIDSSATGSTTALVNSIIPIQSYVVYSENSTPRVGGHINTAVLSRGKGVWGPLLKVLSNVSITEYREEFFREALLLLVRSIIGCLTCQPSVKEMVDTNSRESDDTDSKSDFINARSDQDLCKVLLCLQAQLKGEANVIPAAAYTEFMRLACMCMEAPAGGATDSTTAASIDHVFSRHYVAILDELLVDSYLTTQSKEVPSDIISIDGVPLGEIRWSGTHPLKAAFEVLLKLAPLQSWKQYAKVLAVVIPQVELPPILDKDSREAQEKSYLAVRGETDVYADAEAASTRLSLMASLEGWIRAGSNDWRCSSYIQAASASILKDILCKNLVWRVGRVEATIRKVNLASTHTLLNAGAVQPQHLYEVAGTLVPQITSQLDDGDTSTRHMAILSLTTIFERLRGAFGPQAVQELYPKLIKCLDDSDDEVRIQSCRAIAHFMASSGKGAYSGTALEYTIEQLLIHLDDPDRAVQQVVFEALMVSAKLGEEAAVCLGKKTHQALSSHRDGSWCSKILAELQNR